MANFAALFSMMNETEEEKLNVDDITLPDGDKDPETNPENLVPVDDPTTTSTEDGQKITEDDVTPEEITFGTESYSTNIGFSTEAIAMPSSRSQQTKMAFDPSLSGRALFDAISAARLRMGDDEDAPVAESSQSASNTKMFFTAVRMNGVYHMTLRPFWFNSLAEIKTLSTFLCNLTVDDQIILYVTSEGADPLSAMWFREVITLLKVTPAKIIMDASGLLSAGDLYFADVADELIIGPFTGFNIKSVCDKADLYPYEIPFYDRWCNLLNRCKDRGWLTEEDVTILIEGASVKFVLHYGPDFRARFDKE